MKQSYFILFLVLYLFTVITPAAVQGQAQPQTPALSSPQPPSPGALHAPPPSPIRAPDLSKIPGLPEKIAALANYCDSLKAGGFGPAATVLGRNQALLTTALQGLTLVPAGDIPDSARFFSYAAYAYSHRQDLKIDSVYYYYEHCLALATTAHSAPLIASSCGSLIHIGFEMRDSAKGEGYKKILQSVVDTTTDKMVLRDGYSTLGSYYQHKAWYSTAQDYYLKSLAIRQRQLDTLHDRKSMLEYANQSYLLAQLYMNTGMTDQALSTLYDGNRFRGISGLTDIRFTATFIDAFCKKGMIDSALYYLRHFVDSLEILTRKNSSIPGEVIMPKLAIAQYYMGHGQFEKALPLLDNADSLLRGKDESFLTYEIRRLQGKYYLGTARPAKAIPLLSLALPVANQLSRENYTDILKDMALAYKGIGDATGALGYYQQYVTSLDFLTNEKISRTFADQQTRYETSKKEDRIAFLDKDNRLQILELQNARRTRSLLVLGLFALGLFALLLFFFYRNKEKLNRRLNEKNEQLAVANTQLGLVNTQLELANDTKTRLFGIISHDLRSPISRIVQLLQIRQENPDLLDDQARRHHEQRIKTASGHLLETMEDLLLWSKSQMLHFTPQSFPVAIAPLVNKEIDLQQEYIHERQLTVRQDIPQGLFRNTDDNFLSVILRNLLQNAVKYSDEGGTIVITATGQSIRITNPSATADVTALNARLLDSAISSKGSGLGLQIAHTLAMSIHARISFTGESGILTALVEFS